MLWHEKKGKQLMILPRSVEFNQNRKNESTGNEKFLVHQENILLKKHQGKESHARSMPNMAITSLIADSTPR